MSRSQAVPIRGKRTASYATASSYNGTPYGIRTEDNDSIDYYGRDECPATPHNFSSDLVELHQQDSNSTQPYPLFDGTPDQLNELKFFGIDPNGYGSNINRIQDMWRPHSLWYPLGKVPKVRFGFQISKFRNLNHFGQLLAPGTHSKLSGPLQLGVVLL